ncbi:hypothetical protein GCM10010981_09700 [Dyella nitratireducens]|uniref:Flagellar assembly protein FliH n=1 Tax=Dyella nitratireducens TaxID=1849580 RepID=A0ABQ1FPT7_9GAMM|nr:hypothetical protein GCM10010981_09700 [Dyella nitratireducens]GLQ43967.1 hypothetical protein GCM10007902_38170 [Dyella nitratireducens]
MLIGKVGDWSILGNGVLSSEEAATLQDLVALQQRLLGEQRETRQRLAHSLHKAKKSARQKGYAAGFEEARKQVIAALAAHLKVWRNAEQHLSTGIEKAVREALGEIPASGLLMMRIHQCLLAARESPVLRIHVHPMHFSLVDDVIVRFNREHGRLGCEVIADNHLLQDECRVETETGILNIDFDRQARAIGEAILAELRDNAASAETGAP